MESPNSVGLFVSLFNTQLGLENKRLNEAQLKRHLEVMHKLDEILKELQKK